MDGDFLPAAITHYHLALRALEGYQKAAGTAVPCMDAFLWGAQGPDFLFYHRLAQPWKKNLRKTGNRLHREKPSLLLGAMRSAWRNAGRDPIVESYLDGFLCHYSLDRTAHPFVYFDVSRLKEIYPGRSDGFLHNHVESTLDGIILRMETGKLPTDFDLKTTVPKNRQVQKAISGLYSDVLEKLYGLSGTQDLLWQSTCDCHRISGLLNDRTTMKRALAEYVEKHTGHYFLSGVIRGISESDEFDYANVCRSSWRWPPESPQSRQESFFDLYQASIQESIRFMMKFPTAEDLSALTNEIPFC